MPHGPAGSLSIKVLIIRFDFLMENFFSTGAIIVLEFHYLIQNMSESTYIETIEPDQ